MRWQLALSSRQSISAAERALAQAQGGKTCTSPSLQRWQIRPLSGPQAQNRSGQTGCQSAVQDRRRRCAADHDSSHCNTRTCKTRRSVGDGSETFRCTSHTERCQDRRAARWVVWSVDQDRGPPPPPGPSPPGVGHRADRRRHHRLHRGAGVRRAAQQTGMAQPIGERTLASSDDAHHRRWISETLRREQSGRV